LGQCGRSTKTAATTTFADYDWLYDVAGRITDFDFTSLVGESGTGDYAHDDTDQLTDAAYDYQADEDYVYDENGNRTNNGNPSGSRSYLTATAFLTGVGPAENWSGWAVLGVRPTLALQQDSCSWVISSKTEKTQTESPQAVEPAGLASTWENL